MKILRNKRLILLIAISLVLIGGASAYALYTNRPAETKENVTASYPVTHSKSDTEPQIEVVRPPEKTVGTTQTLETPPPAPTPEPTPVTYKWANEMASAGIAEADYGYVNDMILDENDGWRLFSRNGERVWRSANIPGSTGTICYQELVRCIETADRYVQNAHGSWQAANALWVRAGNF